MQVVYRSVQMMRDDVPGNRHRHEIVNRFPPCQARANRR
jgi:hypothetical protein